MLGVNQKRTTDSVDNEVGGASLMKRPGSCNPFLINSIRVHNGIG